MNQKFKRIIQVKEFESDLKILSKKYRTIEEDLKILIESSIYAFHKLRVDNQGIVQISNLGEMTVKIFKVKKFACRSIPGTGNRSGLRLIYAYCDKDDTIFLIEIYHKNTKENEDRKRIYDLIKNNIIQR